MPTLRPADPSPYWSPEQARQNSIQQFLTDRSILSGNDYDVDPRPKYDYAAQADQFAQQAAQINAQSASNQVLNAANTQFFPHGPNGSVNNSVGGGLGAGRLGAVLRALRQQESGGNYHATNPSGALGAYQILGSNFAGSGGWDVASLGHNVTTQQFMNNPAIQNAIARHIFGGYMNKYGVRGALASWYSGQPNWHSDAPQNGGPSIHDYVMHVLSLI